MSENLYDALEDCLAAMQRGEDIESCLARYPGLATDLRPLLAAAAEAESLAIHAVPIEVAKRGRARLLNQAAELRERAAVSARAAPVVGFRFRRSLRLAVSVFAALLVAFVLGGVGLVFASSGTLPGDPLYRVKRSWEGIRLQWQADPQAREALEHHFEQERVGEVDELIKRGRAEEVEFVGRVTAIFPDHIVVSSITVLLTIETEIDGQLTLEAMVKVEGYTEPDGSVVGREIKVLGSPSQQESGDQDDGGEDGDSGGNSGPSGDPDDPDETEESKPDDESFDMEGALTSAGANKIVVGPTRIILTDSTEIRGTLAEGATVRVRGYIDDSGALIATRVRVISSGGEGGDDGDDGGDDDSGGGDDDEDDDSGDDDDGGDDESGGDEDEDEDDNSG